MGVYKVGALFALAVIVVVVLRYVRKFGVGLFADFFEHNFDELRPHFGICKAQLRELFALDFVHALAADFGIPLGMFFEIFCRRQNLVRRVIADCKAAVDLPLKRLVGEDKLSRAAARGETRGSPRGDVVEHPALKYWRVVGVLLGNGERRRTRNVRFARRPPTHAERVFEECLDGENRAALFVPADYERVGRGFDFYRVESELFGVSEKPARFRRVAHIDGGLRLVRRRELDDFESAARDFVEVLL